MAHKNTAYNISGVKLVVLFIIWVLFLVIPASASYDEGYTITDSAVPGDYIDSSGTDSIRDFEDVPLWIKLSVMSGLFVSSLCFIKLVPFIGRILESKNSNLKRSNIMEFIRKNPGCTTTEIGRCTGLNTGTIRYHIRVLERERDVVSINTGHKLCYFQNKSRYGHDEMVFIAFCRNEKTKDIVRLIKDRPGISHNHISRIISLDKSTVNWHIRRLTDSGIVSSKKEGKFTRFFIAEDMADISCSCLSDSPEA